jgi:uncharacterized membrane protein SpoIIM required for sporulation
VSRDDFVAERRSRWDALDALAGRGGRTPARRDPDGLRRLGALFRATAADLAVARRRFPGDPMIPRLEDLVRRGRQVVYGNDRRRTTFRHFVTTGYWRRVRERPAFLLAGLVLVMGPWLLAAVWATRDPGRAQGLAPGGFSSVVERDRADFGLTAEEKAQVSSEIFTNNVRIAFLAFAAGIAAAIGAAVVLVYQGVVLGAVFGLTIHAGNAEPLFEFVSTHGVLEISCIVVAGAAGMRMGWSLVAPGHRRRAEALAIEARAATEIAVGTGLVLVVCGIIEGTVSTSGIGLVPAIALGLGIGGVFWGLVVWRGRPERAAGPMVPPEAATPVAPRGWDAATAGPAASR